MNTFQIEALEAHNEVRKLHGAPPLQYSEKLSKGAEKYAKALVRSGVLKHSEKNDAGENLASSKGGDLSGKAVTELWASEKKNYDYEKAEFDHNVGHFTQVVWVDTAKMGIYKAVAKDGTAYIVARYYPPGNFVGKFTENVKEEQSELCDRNVDRSIQAADRPDGKLMKKNILKYINNYRTAHNARNVKWSDKLADLASRMGKEILDARANNEPQRTEVRFGRIVLISNGGYSSMKSACKLWYKGHGKYNYDKPEYVPEAGAFTQLIWDESQNIGAGFANNNDDYIFLILFDPPGNVRGKFEANVKPRNKKVELIIQ